VADPQLIVKGVSRFDYSQGSYLGMFISVFTYSSKCWFWIILYLCSKSHHSM